MKKILFFDDEPIVSDYLVKNLQENYEWVGDKEITFVSTVCDLLNEIKNENVTYDLFVLDVMVPMLLDNLKDSFSNEELIKMNYGMSTGIVISKIIRKMEKYKDVPILFLSSRSIPTITEFSETTTSLRKPISPEEISKKMKEMLKIE